MKIYISGPITGTNDYMERFKAAEDTLKQYGHEVVNPAAALAGLPASTTHKEYMDISIALLKLCDTILMLDNWRYSKGSCIELDYAIRNGITVVFEGGAGCEVKSQNRLGKENLMTKLGRRLYIGIAANVYSVK